jgi:hypothetical protein
MTARLATRAACAVLAVAAAFTLSGGTLLGAGGAAPSTEPLRLGVSGAANSGVSLAALGSTVVATWAARSGAVTDVYAVSSRDGGASFDAPVRVNSVAGDARVSGEQAPRVAVSSAARIVWVSSQGGTAVVRSAARPSGESAFAATTTVHREGLTGARGWASLALGPDGAAHVVWLDGRGDPPADGAAVKPVEPGPAGHTGHGSGRHGGSRQDLFQATVRPDGTSTETRIATDVCFCCKTAVATAPDGSVYVAWRHIYKPNFRDIAVARSKDGGRTFEAPVRVSEDGWAIDGCPDDGPSIAVDGGGVLHVAWPTRVSEQGKGIFYSRSTDDGRTFAPRARVDETSGGAGHPQLALAGDRVVVVWDEKGESGRRAQLREIAAGAAAAWPPRLEPAVVLAAGPVSYPAVAATDKATLAAWTEGEGPATAIRVRRIDR